MSHLYRSSAKVSVGYSLDYIDVTFFINWSARRSDGVAENSRSIEMRTVDWYPMM
jgi:hypothetical protein